ncbi:MAG TPA: dual specificity protein phosphatase [Ktedonobacterales bacterium]
MADPEGIVEGERTGEDLAGTTTVVPAQAQAHAARSGRGMLRRGALRWVLSGGMRLTYRAWTRIAARLFPEESAQARLAERIGVPLPDRLNMSWITPQLAVGGRIHPEDLARLAAIGVTRVVDTRAEHSDDAAALAAHGIELLYLPTPDTYPLSLEQLREGADWITRQLASGERVLVHCEHGVGRSVLLTAAALVEEGMSAQEAIHLIQAGRWQAAPNHSQMVRLQEFERCIRAPEARQ